MNLFLITLRSVLRRIAAAMPAICLTAGGALAADWAVILTYNRFGEEGDSLNTIRLDQFEAHLQELASGGYSVMALKDIVQALKTRTPLPDRTVALTIDDAHLSVYREAWPRLKRANLPVTLFVATDTIDRAGGAYMNWSQLRELVAGGADIGNLSVSYPHLPMQAAPRVQQEVDGANARLREELGVSPKLFAYPYGEWSQAVRNVVIERGFAAAFGQQSGPAHSSHDWYSLPRFPMNESLGSLGRFRLAVGALPLRIGELTPDEPVITSNPPSLGFTVMEPRSGLDRLACFSSSQAAPALVERLGERRIEVRLEQPFPPGRTRVNCTMPGADNRWHWLGLLFLQPTER